MRLTRSQPWLGQLVLATLASLATLSCAGPSTTGSSATTPLPNGKAGSTTPVDVVVGPDASARPHAELAREAAERAGILGALGAQDSTAIFGTGQLGDEALGGLIGGDVGEAFGAGGLGLSGSGLGGGGTGSSIGLGSVGTLGHGAGAGTGQGFGSGGGGRIGTRSASAQVQTGSTTVTGRLPPEVIRRVVRQSLARYRYCYERALVGDPTLAGRVTVKFVIAASGAVATADATTDLKDPAVKACVTQAFKTLMFPKPEGGGVVVVTYPLVFQPGDGAKPSAASAAAAASAPVAVVTLHRQPLAIASAADLEAALSDAHWTIVSSVRRNGAAGASSVVDVVAEKDGVRATITFQPAKHADAGLSVDEMQRIDQAGATRTEGDFFLGVVVAGDAGGAETLLRALVSG